jgi:HEAT repeat protein
MKYVVKTLRKFVRTTVIVSIFSLYLFPVMYLQADEVAILSQALNHEDLIVRLSAIKALGELRDVSAVRSLIAVLRDESCGCTAANALVKIGKPSVEPLIMALKDKSPIVRRNVLKALGGIGNPNAVKPLIDALKDEDFIVRGNAATALGQIKDANAVQALIDALGDKSPIVRRNAAIALGQIKDVRSVKPLIDALKDKDAIVRANAATALGEMDIFCLLPIGCHIDDNVIVLIRKLNHEDLIVRLSAIKALGEIKDAIAVEPLVTILGDGSCGYTAANALAKIGKPSIEPLCAALKDDNTVARRSAAMSLGKIKDSAAVESLITAMKDEDLIVRRNAATALGQIRDGGAVAPLITALNDENPIVRRVAATALGNIKDAGAVAPLIDALKDKDAIVRANAVAALGEIGKSAVEALIANILD